MHYIKCLIVICTVSALQVSFSVIPVKTGIQWVTTETLFSMIDSGLHRSDGVLSILRLLITISLTYIFHQSYIPIQDYHP